MSGERIAVDSQYATLDPYDFEYFGQEYSAGDASRQGVVKLPKQVLQHTAALQLVDSENVRNFIDPNDDMDPMGG